MNLAEIYHREAVHFTERADIASIKEGAAVAKELYFKAYLSEKNAAFHQYSESFDPMPKTWLMQSAAGLAFKAGHLEEAAKTISLCRSLGPDEYTIGKLEELEALLQEAAKDHSPNVPMNITGLITSANDDEKEIQIKETSSERVYSLIVPANMFKEVVKSYWLEVVNAVAQVSPHGVFTLKKISKAA